MKKLIFIFLVFIGFVSESQITPLASQLEFETNTTSNYTSQTIDSLHVIVFWRGVGNDGFVQVFEANPITYQLSAIGTALEFDVNNYSSGSSGIVDEDHFILFWSGGSTNDGMAQVFEVDEDYVVTAMSTPVNFFATANFNSCQKIDEDHFINFWSGTAGYAQAFSINLSSYAVSEIGTELQFDASLSRYITSEIVDEDHFIGIWQSASTDGGFAQSFEVNLSTYAVTTNGTAIEFETNDNFYNNVVKIDNNHFINSWRGEFDPNIGKSQTLEVNLSTYAVTALSSPFVFYNSNSPVFISSEFLDSAHIIVMFTDANVELESSIGPGYAKILSFSTLDYSINQYEDSIQFDDVSSYSSLIRLDNFHYVNFWAGTSNYGNGQVFHASSETGTNYLSGTGYELGNYIRSLDRTDINDTLSVTGYDLKYTSGTISNEIDSSGIYLDDVQMSNNEIDLLLIDLANTGDVNGTIEITGSFNGTRTNNSDDAVATLTANGWLVNVNYNVTLVHFMTLSQSQGIGTSAFPVITTDYDPNVFSLGDTMTIDPDEPIVNISTWNLDTAIEKGIVSSNTVETGGLAMGRDFINKAGPTYKVCVTICGQGGQSLSSVMRGGSNGLYERLMAASARVKYLADSAGWTYRAVFIVMHGGDIGTFASNRIRIINEDLAQDLPEGVEYHLQYDGIRQVDFIGDSYYEGSGDQGRILRNDTVDVPITMYYRDRNYPIFRDSTITYSHPRSQIGRGGDDVHHTNNQMRWNGHLHSETAYRKIIKGESPTPLYLGEPSWDGDSLTVPILGHEGMILSGSGNYQVAVWNETDSLRDTIQVVLSGTNLRIALDTIEGWKRYVVYANFSDDLVNGQWYPWTNDTELGTLYAEYTPDFPSLYEDDDNPGFHYDLDKYLAPGRYPIFLERYTGSDATHVTPYIGAESIRLIQETTGIEKTSYIVGYTTEDTGRSGATVISDANGSGGAFRCVISNTGDTGNDQDTTIFDNGSTQILNENTTYYIHMVTQNTGPSTIENVNRSITTHERQTDIVYSSDSRGWIKRFRLYVPDAYWQRLDPNEKWPWKLSYHGAGEQPSTNNPETGEAYDASDLNAFAEAIDDDSSYQDIVISPQWHEGSANRDEAYHILVNEIEGNLGIRLEDGGLLFGFSQGGSLPYTFGEKYPERVAAIITSAAFTRIDGTSGDGNEMWEFDIADKPELLWQFPMVLQHNAGDGTVSVGHSTDIVAAVNALTGAITPPDTAVSVDDGSGTHEGWTDISRHENGTYDYFQDVGNASNEEEFYRYHLNNTYSYWGRIDQVLTTAEYTECTYDKNRIQDIVYRNTNKLLNDFNQDTIDNFQSRIDAVIPRAVVEVDQDSLDFWYQETGAGATPAFTVTVTNTGCDTLVISSVALSTNPSGVFAITAGNSTPYSIAPDGIHQISVTFDPDSESHFDGVLRILSNALFEDTVDIILDGDGITAFTTYFTIQANVGESLATVSGWTNIDSPAAVTEADDEEVEAATNIDGEGVDFTYFAIGSSIWGFDAGGGSSGNGGYTAGGDGPEFPALVLRDYVFTQGQGAAHETGFRFEGLTDDDRRYELTLIGSRDATGTRPTQHRILSTYTGGQGELTESHNVVDNNSLTNFFTGLQSSGGIIEVLQRNTSGTAFHYLNGWILVEYGP